MRHSLVFIALTGLSAGCSSDLPGRLPSASTTTGGSTSVAAHAGGSVSASGGGSTHATGGSPSAPLPTSGGTLGNLGVNSTSSGGAASGGAATVPASGGAGGSSQIPPVIPAAGSSGLGGELDGLRWEALCRVDISAGGFAACPNVPADGMCPTDKADPTGDRTGYYSTDKIFTFPGTPGVTYNVGIHVRGVVEFRDYQNGTHDGEHFYIGGVAPDAIQGEEVHLNLYSLEVSAPHQIYFLNHNGGLPTGFGSSVGLVDQTKTIAIEGGATVHAVAFDRNCNAYSNCESYDGVCKPLLVPGVAPYPAAFNGQFLQLDVTSVSPKN